MAEFEKGPRIAILGGTGAQGSGLALRWARAGYAVIVGSRSEERAIAAAAALAKEAPDAPIEGMANPAAAAAADIVVMTVPYENHTQTLGSVRDAVQGKIFVDVTVPLVPPRVSRVQLPPEGSAAKAAQTLLGEGVQAPGRTGDHVRPHHRACAGRRGRQRRRHRVGTGTPQAWRDLPRLRRVPRDGDDSGRQLQDGRGARRGSP